ncbi:hypothetical protein IC582_013469 [Cucumis melo]
MTTPFTLDARTGRRLRSPSPLPFDLFFSSSLSASHKSQIYCRRSASIATKQGFSS